MRGLIAISLLLLASTAVAQHDHGSHDHGDVYFDSGSGDQSEWLQTNDTYEFTFDITHGTFDYHCHPHPDMQGSIIVEGEAMDHAMDDGMMGTVHEVRIVDSAQGLDFADWGYEPAELTIQVGDTVRWINAGEIPHTVTAMDAAPHAHEHNDAPGIGAFLVFAAVALVGAVLHRR